MHLQGHSEAVINVAAIFEAVKYVAAIFEAVNYVAAVFEAVHPSQLRPVLHGRVMMLDANHLLSTRNRLDFEVFQLGCINTITSKTASQNIVCDAVLGCGIEPQSQR